MARTESTMLPFGTTAPDFEPPDIEGKTVRLTDFTDAKGLVVIFLCKPGTWSSRAPGNV